MRSSASREAEHHANQQFLAERQQHRAERASSARSISLLKVVILRRYKSEPAATAVESALAMFS
jgi:hypothetical protein